MGQGEMVQNRGFNVVQVVSSSSSLKNCQDVYLRFLELAQRRFDLQGETGRIQPCVEITRILNNKGHGLETLGIIEYLRRSLDPRERDWRCPTTNLIAAIPRLRCLESWVKAQPYVPPDGGQSRIARGLYHHPDDCLEAN